MPLYGSTYMLLFYSFFVFFQSLFCVNWIWFFFVFVECLHCEINIEFFVLLTALYSSLK